jgi:MoxR-like ATPase
MEVRKNEYRGPCRECGAEVAPFAGRLTKSQITGKWETRHLEGTCPPVSATTKAPGVTPDVMSPAVDKVIGLMAAKFTELVPELVKDNLALLARTTEIQVGKMPAIKIDTAHKLLPDIVTAVVAGTTPFLVGPAGSGKTTLAEQVCKVLKRPFYMEARVTSEFKLTGFIDANGHCVRTQFREAYEKGGGFLFDEVDASDPDAMTSFNSGLANDIMPFPDGLVKRHKDFFAIAAGNTFGRGADRQYVGRNQLDAATLDRFQTFEVDYDEELELTLAGNLEWTKFVQRVRYAVEREKVRHIVSPRASIAGAKLLAAGMERAKVEEACVWKGMDAQTRTRVTARMMEAPRAAA